MNNQDGVSVVIPAFNEEGAIRKTLDSCCQALYSLEKPFEIIVVDDGSTDATARIAEAASAKVIRHPVNGGYGRSLKDGIQAASYDTIVTIDADGTYPANMIPTLIAEYERGGNCIVGLRSGKHYRESLIKMAMRYLLRLLVEFASGRSIPDINSGMRVFSRKEIIPYFPRLCEAFSFSTSQTLAYLMTNKYIMYVDISYHERIGNSKISLFKDSLKALLYIVQAVLYYNPLKIFIIMSLFCIIFGIGSALSGVLAHITAGYYIGIGCIICSIIVFSLGLLAEQLRQIILKDNDAG